MNLQDFADQLAMVDKVGSLSQIAKFIPGMSSMKISDQELERGERETRKFRAIIGSMTQKERLVPQVLDGQRKLRIARGSGVQVSDVNVLLKRFEESQQFAKLFKKLGRGGKGFFR